MDPTASSTTLSSSAAAKAAILSNSIQVNSARAKRTASPAAARRNRGGSVKKMKENVAPSMNEDGAHHGRAPSDVRMREPAPVKCCGCPPEKHHKYLLKKIGRPGSHIYRGRESFPEVFNRSTMLIDRTPFLLALMEVRDKINANILITMPGGTGKSMLMGMTRSFFEDFPQRRAENRLIFEHTFCDHNPKFTIAQKEHRDFFERHQGKYPVIHLDFSCMAAGLEAMKESIRDEIVKLFKENLLLGYIDGEEAAGKMTGELATMYRKEYARCMGDGGLDEAKWPNAIRLLMELMARRSSQRVMVLIDEYDKPIYENKRIEEWEDAIQLVGNFVKIFEGNSDLVAMVLVFGRYRFAAENIDLRAFEVGIEDDRNSKAAESSPATVGRWISQFFSIRNKRMGISELENTLRTALAQCFGFLDAEVQELCDSNKFEWRKEAKYWYNGYALGRIPLYSSHSVLLMLASWDFRKPKEQRHSTETATFMPYFKQPYIMEKYFCSIFRSTNIAPDLNALLNGKRVPMRKIEDGKFSITKMRQLLKHAIAFENDSQSNFDVNAHDLFLGFLHASGYIIRDGDSFKIPNEELRRTFQLKMAEFYFVPRFQVPIMYYDAVTDILRKILFNPTATLNGGDRKRAEDRLKTAFEALLNAPAAEGGGKARTARGEHNLHVSFETAAYRIFGWHYFAGDHSMNGEHAENSKKRPDIILCSNSRAVALCVELKHGTGVDKMPKFAIGQIIANCYVGDHPEIESMEDNLERIVMLGINGHEKREQPRGGRGGTAVATNSSTKKMQLGKTPPPPKMTVDILMECGRRKAGENGRQFLRRFQGEMANKYRNDVEDYKRHKAARKRREREEGRISSR